MNCDGVRGLLSAYVDGELSAGELLRVEQHLRRCHTCADEVDSLRQTIALVASLDEVEVPATFHANLHERLVALGPPVAAGRRVPGAPAWQRNARRWAVPAAAAAAALAIGLNTFPQASLRIAEGINGGRSQFIVDNQEVATTAGPVPTGSDKPVSSTDGGGESGTAIPNPSGPKPPSGGQNSTAPANPDQNQPSAGNPPARPDQAYAVTQPPAPVTTPVVLEPRLTYSATVSAALESQEALSKALSGYTASFDAASVIVTVPAEQRQAFFAALGSAAGVKLTGEPVVTETNLAEQIYQETNQRNWNLQELERVEKQISKLTDDAQRQESIARQKALQENLQRSETTLQILNDRVGKAFITVHFQVQGR